MKFYKTTWFWITYFGSPDISAGFHICMKGRIDIHILMWMFSFGNVPLYEKDGKIFAVSNSYHSDKRKTVRAGIPQ